MYVDDELGLSSMILDRILGSNDVNLGALNPLNPLYVLHVLGMDLVDGMD